ncbi:MAG: hypothetical protein ACKVK4_08160 [Flavobacteriales bacterium]|jgi:hypothetical protein|nr:hypothetical protein [Flavobacteriaceae bacterium]MDB4227937.1 hypothetical protein [Flavobacteriaceae bacterium]|tara:strand:+ start:96 stop:488 length:393 start_codon:yes stop_codon:yes gene_type:complete
MGKISTKLEINIEIDVVYNNLKNRYNSERFKKASIDTKGYVPPIELIKNEVNSKLVFKAKGTDSLTKMKIGEWKWSYDFRDLGEKRTEIIISYEWSSLMEFLSFFTIKHQAANELTETVLSLDSLEYLNV